MTALQHSGSTIWRYWLQGPRDAWRQWLGGGVAGALVAGLCLVAAFQLDAESAAWVTELLPPLFAAVFAAYSAAEHERSGFAALLQVQEKGRFEILVRRAVASGVFGLAAGLVGTLAVILYSPPSGAFRGLLASLSGIWFLAALASLAASYFRSWMIGLAIASVPWLASAIWGFGQNPLLCLLTLRAIEDRDPLQGLWLVNKPLLVVAGSVCWGMHALLKPDSLHQRVPGSVPRVAAIVATIIAAYWITGVASVLCVGAALAAAQLGMRPTELGERLERFHPVPANRLLGPAFAAYVGDGLSKNIPEFYATRVDQLIYALQRWPKSVWAPGIAEELRTQLSNWYPETEVMRPYDSSNRPIGDLNRTLLVRLLNPSFPGPSERQRAGIAVHLATDFAHTPEGKTAALYLLNQVLPGLSGDSAREIGLAVLRIAPVAERPLWYAFLARAQLEHEGRESALGYAERASSGAASLLKAATAGQLSLDGTQIERLEALREEMSEILSPTNENRRPHAHSHTHSH